MVVLLPTVALADTQPDVAQDLCPSKLPLAPNSIAHNTLLCLNCCWTGIMIKVGSSPRSASGVALTAVTYDLLCKLHECDVITLPL